MCGEVFCFKNDFFGKSFLKIGEVDKLNLKKLIMTQKEIAELKFKCLEMAKEMSTKPYEMSTKPYEEEIVLVLAKKLFDFINA